MWLRTVAGLIFSSAAICSVLRLWLSRVRILRSRGVQSGPRGRRRLPPGPPGPDAGQLAEVCDDAPGQQLRFLNPQSEIPTRTPVFRRLAQMGYTG